jgi:hypothetical protein
VRSHPGAETSPGGAGGRRGPYHPDRVMRRHAVDRGDLARGHHPQSDVGSAARAGVPFQAEIGKAPKNRRRPRKGRDAGSGPGGVVCECNPMEFG